jgi:hypothetical protein
VPWRRTRALTLRAAAPQPSAGMSCAARTAPIPPSPTTPAATGSRSRQAVNEAGADRIGDNRGHDR